MPGSTSGNDGFVMLPKFILNHTNLNPDAIVLYCNLLHFDRGAGKLGCVAKRTTLANICGFSIHRVRRAVKLLEDEGIISVIRRRNSLTDRIRITPDCRPPTKSTTRPKPTTDLSTPTAPNSNRRKKRVRESPPLNDLPNIKCSTLKANDTEQGINIGPNPSNSLTSTAETKTTPISPPISYRQPSPAPPLNPKHLQATERLKSRIRHQIRDASYLRYFADILVVSEDDNCLILHTPKGNLYKEFISNRFYDDLKEILGKEICIVS